MFGGRGAIRGAFTARGPAYPVNVALKHDASTGIGTLTWSRNPAGTTPAKYRVYGSDEKGFTVHDAPYEVQLGDDQELTNPFPANFVAEVAGTSLDVVGVGNALPNANKAYYRVVAVDGQGNRSGDSDYVEAPRPFIYSAPVTAAPAGRPYQLSSESHPFHRRPHADGTTPSRSPARNSGRSNRLKFSLTRKPAWMNIDADTGLITGTPDGTGGTVTVSVTLAKEHRLVHDEHNIMWGNEYEQSRTYETAGPVTQEFVVSGAKKSDATDESGSSVVRRRFPLCPMVWEGRSREASPYPDSC